MNNLVEQLNERFSINDEVSFSLHRGGIPLVRLKHSSGASAEISLFGAHVLSWRAQDVEELLFLSKSSDLSGKKAIRGGIPLVFPQFGSGALPSHGFARNMHWDFQSSEKLSDGRLSVTFRLQQNEDTLKLWHHAFETTYAIELKDNLKSELCVKNSGQTSFTFQNALHTYFAVGDIRQTAVFPLGALEYLDSTKQRARFLETREHVTFEEETDRIYIDAPQKLTISDAANGRELYIEKRGFRDAVVWNPWIERTKQLADLQPADYLRFVCVEAGNVNSPIRLEPAEQHRASQTLSFAKTN